MEAVERTKNLITQSIHHLNKWEIHKNNNLMMYNDCALHAWLIDKDIYDIFSQFLDIYNKLTSELSDSERNEIIEYASNLPEVMDRRHYSGALKYKILHNLDSERFLRIVRFKETKEGLCNCPESNKELKKLISEHPLTHKEILSGFNNYIDEEFYPILSAEKHHNIRYLSLNNIVAPEFKTNVVILWDASDYKSETIGGKSSGRIPTIGTVSNYVPLCGPLFIGGTGFDEDLWISLNVKPEMSYDERAITFYHELLHVNFRTYNYDYYSSYDAFKKNVLERDEMENIIENEAKNLHEENPEFYKELKAHPSLDADKIENYFKPNRK